LLLIEKENDWLAGWLLLETGAHIQTSELLS
jgi:hypothetical protein